MLFQIPQRYRFSSKSQPLLTLNWMIHSCFRYHKGTDFQANHNVMVLCLLQLSVVLDTTKVQIFKQITTKVGRMVLSTTLFQIPQRYRFSSKSQHFCKNVIKGGSCFRYHKGTDFQANHNYVMITILYVLLFQIPQRYRFSSKSQLLPRMLNTLFRCFRYHKGTDFQANHNTLQRYELFFIVVLDTTKVQIFKQITTTDIQGKQLAKLFQIPQRYRFSSKSQQ